MKCGRLLPIVPAVLLITGICGIGPADAQQPQVKVATPAPPAAPAVQKVNYPLWGFSAEVPNGYRRVGQMEQKFGKQDAFNDYFAGERVFLSVSALEGDPNMPADRVLDMLMGMIRAMAPEVSVQSWNFASEQSGFTAYSLELPPLTESDLQGADQYSLQAVRMLGNERGIVLLAVASYPQAPHVAVAISALAPVSRAGEGRHILEKVATSVKWAGWSAVENLRKNRGKGTGRTYPQAVLQQGQIQICGKVEVMSADRKRLTMMADEVTIYGGKPAKLNPPREKVVFLTEPMEGLGPGAIISVVADNSGQGQPVTAREVQTVTPAPAR